MLTLRIQLLDAEPIELRPCDVEAGLHGFDEARRRYGDSLSMLSLIHDPTGMVLQRYVSPIDEPLIVEAR